MKNKPDWAAMKAAKLVHGLDLEDDDSETHRHWIARALRAAFRKGRKQAYDEWHEAYYQRAVTPEPIIEVLSPREARKWATQQMAELYGAKR